jgi:glycosyltransferase involved in cell wall biosynthesis
MHILIVALHRPTEPTGVCRHAANLARCLAETDRVDKITLVTGAWQQHYFQTDFLLDPAKIAVLGIEIENTSLARNFWFLFGLPNLVKQLQADLVHLSFPLPVIKSLFACPIVSTIHDLYPYKIPDNFGRKKSLFNRLSLQQCIKNSDALSCVSNTTFEDLLYYFPQLKSKQDRVRVIYNFVDFDRVEAKLPHKLQHQVDGQQFILCVGQHRKNKNFDILIQAYSKLRQDGRLSPAPKLIIVGSPGPETDNLHRSIHNLRLTDSVIAISAINDNELCWLYQNCQLMVIPSSLEGFCIPLVEALYFSAKVVCSDIPIFREIAGDNCIYFDLEGDAIDNLARSISTALDSDLPPAIDSCDRFTKTAIATRYRDFYLQVI